MKASLTTLYSIRREGQNLAPDQHFTTPGKKRPPIATKTNLPDFDRDVVRRHVHDCFLEGIVPTLDKLLPRIRENTHFTGGRTSFYRLLRSLGFQYGKSNGRQFHLERGDIVAARHAYLRRMRPKRDCPTASPVIYQDETWLNASHTVKKCWQKPSQANEEPTGLKVPTGKGGRLIINRAGSKNGFIANGLLIFKAKSQTGDYHDEMNGGSF